MLQLPEENMNAPGTDARSELSLRDLITNDSAPLGRFKHHFCDLSASSGSSAANCRQSYAGRRQRGLTLLWRAGNFTHVH